MKIRICDICKSEKIIKECHRVVGYKGGNKLDVCPEHNKTLPATKEAFDKLYAETISKIYAETISEIYGIL